MAAEKNQLAESSSCTWLGQSLGWWGTGRLGRLFDYFYVFDDFYENLQINDKLYKLKNQSVVFHFRISTSGKIDEGNCHPYPLTDDSIYLRKTNLRCSIGIAHNGIIQKYNRKDSVLNDT